MAHERTLPVPDALGGLFVEGGLVRGRTLACQGPAATSTALTPPPPLVAPAGDGLGAWMAVIDVPTVGLDAAM